MLAEELVFKQESSNPKWFNSPTTWVLEDKSPPSPKGIVSGEGGSDPPSGGGTLHNKINIGPKDIDSKLIACGFCPEVVHS